MTAGFGLNRVLRRTVTALMLLMLPAWRAHPLHTTFTELTAQSSGIVTITVRLFTEDLAVAISKRSGRTFAGRDAIIPDSLALDYLRAHFALGAHGGHPAQLRWSGQRRTADVSFLTLSADLPAGLAGATLADSIHCELFDDQVNIVKATYAGRSESMLFTRGDPPKTLP
ncbi:MAG: DUF6702 family protein [Gemmatimonadota bacterium]